jgi:hypothetical protein
MKNVSVGSRVFGTDGRGHRQRVPPVGSFITCAARREAINAAPSSQRQIYYSRELLTPLPIPNIPKLKYPLVNSSETNRYSVVRGELRRSPSVKVTNFWQTLQNKGFLIALSRSLFYEFEEGYAQGAE